MKKINGKKISLCSNAQDRMRRFACLQDCLLTLTCHLARTCLQCAGWFVRVSWYTLWKEKGRQYTDLAQPEMRALCELVGTLNV